MSLLNILPKIWANKAGIAEGIKNKLIKKKDIEDLSEYRMSICKTCPWYSENVRALDYTELPEEVKGSVSEAYIKDSKNRADKHCVNCSCMLSLKTRCLVCVCPTKRWDAVVKTQQEADSIMEMVQEEK